MAKEKPKKKTFTVILMEDDLEFLENEAVEEGNVSVGAIIRKAIHEYKERKTKNKSKKGEGKK